MLPPAAAANSTLRSAALSPGDYFASTTSYEWSGVAIQDNSAPFKTTAVIIGEFVVPLAHQAFGSCTGDWDDASIWLGIDGFTTSYDVLQAGAYANAYCGSDTARDAEASCIESVIMPSEYAYCGSDTAGVTVGIYSAWVEWAPNKAVLVSSPTIHPGDLVFVEVWNTSPTNGYAYFYNHATQKTAEYQLTAFQGYPLVGDSVEWIVERPYTGYERATLTNYIDVPFSDGYAWNYRSSGQAVYDMGSIPPTGIHY